MHQSGIEVDSELLQKFNSAQEDASIEWMSIAIEKDAFKLTDTGTGSFDTVRDHFKAKTPAYVAMQYDGKWLLIIHVPDNSPVRLKMLFASSTSALRSGLDNSKFVNPNYSITAAVDCSEEEYKGGLSKDQDNVMSYEEKDKRATAFEHAHLMGSNKTSVIADVPIQIADPALEALKSFAAGTGSNTSEFFMIFKDEVLNVGESTDMSIADIAGKFPEKEPRFYLHNYTHTNPTTSSSETKTVFVYYCPNNAPPKLKMLYSTSKSHILRCLSELKVEKPFNVECNDPTELTDEILLVDMYPPVAVDKSFKKPKPRGKPKIAKFQA